MHRGSFALATVLEARREGLKLDNAVTGWDAELGDLMGQAEFDSILRRDVNIPNPLRLQNSVGQSRPFSQDIFSALIVRERGV